MRRLFSYRTERRAERMLAVLRASNPGVCFVTHLRPDWRFYIQAVFPDGRRALVARASIAAITAGGLRAR
jgi:hypothetical protein